MAVFAGRWGVLPPAGPTHSGLTPYFAPNHLTDTFRAFRVLCVPHSAYRKLSRLSNIVLGNSLGGRTELLNYERS